MARFDIKGLRCAPLVLATLALVAASGGSPSSHAQTHEAASPVPAAVTGPPGFVGAWGGTGTDEGQFNGPMGVMARSGEVVVMDSGNHRVHGYSPNGTFEGVAGHGVLDGSDVFQQCTPLTLMTTSPCLPGIAGSGTTQFNNPIDVADDDDDNSWVTDTGNNRVLVFPDGYWNVPLVAPLGAFGSAGTAEGQFMGIHGIFVTDATYHAYVTEVGNHRVQKFIPTSPTTIAFDRMWGRGVDDGGAAGQICTASCQAGTPGAGEGEFNGPRKAIVGGPLGSSSGNVIVADTGNHRLQLFDTNGSFIEMWGFGVDDGSAVFQVCTSACQAGIAGSGDGQFNLPSYLAVDAAGNILVADQGNHRIQMLDSTGAFLTKWGSFGTGDGQFSSPGGVFAAPIGAGHNAEIYVSDASDRIQIFQFGTSPPFTDDPLVPGFTLVKAVHFTELRDRIAALRATGGLSVFTWTDDPLVAGTTPVKAVHILELRTALEEAYAAAMEPPPTYADPGLNAGTSILAAHVTELRTFIVALE